MERERTPLEFDAAEMARALRSEPQARSEGAVDFQLRNELLDISLRLTVDPTKRTVSIYLRGSSAFLGFMHMIDIEEMRADEERAEVWFLAGDGEKLAVQDVGVFLLTTRAVYASGEATRSA